MLSNKGAWFTKKTISYSTKMFYANGKVVAS